MSRIGKQPINLPEGTKATIEGSYIHLQGPKGVSSHLLPECIDVVQENNILKLTKKNNTKKAKSLYGLSRTLINNMIIGVSSGFLKQLEIHGVGYRSQMEGKKLILNVGYSHSIEIRPEESISITVENNTLITVQGHNKETVGQTAAKIRAIRPPEPYKGKGIRYRNEVIKRKVGKASK